MLLRRVALVCLLSACTVLVQADDDTLTRERVEFKQAWQAAEKGDLTTLAPYLQSLRDYPLYPYLRYAYLEATLDTAPDGLVEQFLDENEDLPMAEGLRQDWLLALAKRQEWAKILAYYHDEMSPALRCVGVSAHYLKPDEPDHKLWTAEAQRLWSTPSSPPQACGQLFDYLDSHKLITNDMRRKRVELALEARDSAGARALLPGLPADDRRWAETWLYMDLDPSRELELMQVPDDYRYQQMMITGVREVARNQPLRAEHLWNLLGHRYHFSEEQNRDMRSLLALQQAWHLMPGARAALKQLRYATDPEVPEWRTRLALRAGDWREALHDIESMGAGADTPEWRYWRARSLAALGRQTDAHWLYSTIARSADYYGFLAADRLHLAYAIVQEGSKPDDAVIQQLSLRPGLVRARELVYAGLYPEAEAEWDLATRNLSAAARCQAGLLAEHWGWHARVIPLMASGGCWQDLSLIYPLAFTQTLETQATRLKLDLSWIYGLIRAESVFRPNAVSHVGALGLMQLMPSTGRDEASRIGLSVSGDQALLDPDTNLQVGSAYAHDLLKRFDGSEPLATAAYNAGYARVEDWLPDTGALPMDVWIDTIPYTETRNYVHRVMGHTVMFDWRINGTPQRLSARIGDTVGLGTPELPTTLPAGSSTTDPNVR